MISPDVRKKVQDAMREIDIAMNEIDSQKEHIKDIIAKVAEEHDLEKKNLRKMAKIYHKQNLSTVKLENDMVVDLYEQIFSGSGDKT